MNRLFLVLSATGIALLASCNTAEVKQVKVTNPSAFDRQQVVELSNADVKGLVGEASYVVVDPSGHPVQSQITTDSSLIFLASVPASSTASYGLRILKDGESLAATDTVARACGKVYPQRDDDIAWENDRVAFRAYGPKIQRKGEKMYGYDLFLKRDTAGPMLDHWYGEQCSGENWRKVNDLRAAGQNEEADIFVKSFTYHEDHGYGMDCYAVGPTLGAGASALLDDNGQIIFPWCYADAEIVENGPVRFSAILTYNPMVVGEDTVVETRVITLDLGSRLNSTAVCYDGLSQPRSIITGLALRDTIAEKRSGSSDARYISYIDPTQGPDNGQAFVGAAFPFAPESVEVLQGHLAAKSTYTPGEDYIYYWGYGWDRSDMPSQQEWNAYLEQYAQGLLQPFTVTFEK